MSALEGKFSVKKKGAGHPHTNMGKATLDMLKPQPYPCPEPQPYPYPYP